MENYVIVRPQHLNHNGHLFGGQTLQWIDEFSWIAATIEFPGNKFVTKYIGEASFNRGIPLGAIVKFDINMKRKGITSVTYQCDVYIVDDKPENREPVFSSPITFTAVGDDGHRTAIK